MDNTDLSSNDLEIFNKVVSALKQLDQEGRERMIESVGLVRNFVCEA